MHLQSGLVLVDSPGVGETEAMKKMVLDYITNAAAFIFVIDSKNAGGMLERVNTWINACLVRLRKT